MSIDISDIIVTKDNVLIISSLLVFLSFILMLIIYFYNKLYIKYHKKDFLNLFFGNGGGDQFNKAGGELIVVAYWFTVYYSNYKIFMMKYLFPSIQNHHLSTLPIMPNTYLENVKFFESSHRSWLIINLSSMYFSFFSFLFFIFYTLFFVE